MIHISFFGILASIFSPIWHLFLEWLSIFAAPIEEPEMFWIIIPIWINWFFTEFFQEKHGTSFGNAASNGAIAILAGVDWTRYLYRLLEEGTIRFTFGVFMKFLLAIGIFIFGVYIIILGIKTKKIVHFIGKIRWVTYVLVMATPMVYGVVHLTFITLLAILVFFPLYYWVIEVFDRISPEPKYYKSGGA